MFDLINTENGMRFAVAATKVSTENLNKQTFLSYTPIRDYVTRKKVMRKSAFVTEILLLMRVTKNNTLSVSLILDSFTQKTLKSLGTTMSRYPNLFKYDRKARTVTRIDV